MVKKVLWTGGWDSTFRVLDLVLNKKQLVEPYYIIDHQRTSTEMELKTMDLIIQMTSTIDQKAPGRFLKRIEIKKEEIPTNNELTNAYKRLAKLSHLGTQYDWLARYTYSSGIKDLELCIHIDDTVEGFIKDDVKLIEEDDDRYFVIEPPFTNPDLKIFANYRYPLYDLTKLEMEKISKESGFLHIMEKTWFCHTPIGDEPCGLCNPCKYTRGEGLGRRVPDPSFYRKVRRKISRKINAMKRKVNFK